MKYSFASYYLDSPLVKGRVFDVFEPERVTKDVALFIVHGGGWHAGSRASFHEIMEKFNEQGYIVASTDYRLYAPNAFEQILDIRDSYMCFCNLLKEKNRPLKIAVYGESAGAHLASMLLCADPGECGEAWDETREWIKPEMGILQATPVDLLPWDEMMPQTWSMIQSAVGVPYADDPKSYERLSLKNYIREDNPPIFFMEAELETMFLSEHTLKVAEQQRAMGIASHWKIYQKMEHGFFYELRRKGQREAFANICLFMEGKLQTI